jgi:hypothetical protein
MSTPLRFRLLATFTSFPVSVNEIENAIHHLSFLGLLGFADLSGWVGAIGNQSRNAVTFWRKPLSAIIE